MTDEVDVYITLYVFLSNISILNLALLHRKHKAKKLVAVIHRHPNNRFNYMHPFIFCCITIAQILHKESQQMDSSDDECHSTHNERCNGF